MKFRLLGWQLYTTSYFIKIIAITGMDGHIDANNLEIEPLC